MAKGYWIARVDVTDLDGYQEYVALNAAPLAEFGGRFVVRGGPHEAVVGESRQRNVVVEFPSYQAAVDCFYSEGYQKALAVRQKTSVSEQVIIEGYDGSQPGQ
ncbi:hypothetical protein ATO13_07400 [Stappia sp. 22II-S9-Z10]|nr:hypothetical protein ATO13_07400 [Stappia sp. 22II-S9-Z10]